MNNFVYLILTNVPNRVCWFELSLAKTKFFSLTLTVRGLSNEHCLLTFFILHVPNWSPQYYENPPYFVDGWGKSPPSFTVSKINPGNGVLFGPKFGLGKSLKVVCSFSQELKEQMDCLAEARDQMMEKLQSLKSSTKERLSENEEELQALKDTNDKLKEMVNTMEAEKETWKRNIEELGAQKQVAWSAGNRPISTDFHRFR